MEEANVDLDWLSSWLLERLLLTTCRSELLFHIICFMSSCVGSCVFLLIVALIVFSSLWYWESICSMREIPWHANIDSELMNYSKQIHDISHLVSWLRTTSIRKKGKGKKGRWKREGENSYPLDLNYRSLTFSFFFLPCSGLLSISLSSPDIIWSDPFWNRIISLVLAVNLLFGEHGDNATY